MTDSTRRGRRAGKPETKNEILHAARGLFFEHGYAQTSVRAIARAAGVDAALVYHYFGSKRGLFIALVHLAYDPVRLLARVLDDPDRSALGPRLVATALEAWESESWQVLRASVIADPDLWPVLTGFFSEEILGQRILASTDHRGWRLSGVETQMIGMIVGRYLARIEPLASMPRADVVRMIGPIVQHFLVGDPTR